MAQEAEVLLRDPNACLVDGDAPELFFCRDLAGYGWCVRKGNYLNVGIGRRDPVGFPAHVRAFSAWLEGTGRVPAAARAKWHGHAYLLAGSSVRNPVGEGILLIGDSAGIAYPESGEGIGPAIESGLAAAKVILDAADCYTTERLTPYAEWVRDAFPARRSIPAALRPCVPAIGRMLLGSATFTRRIVIDRWFLRGDSSVGLAFRPGVPQTSNQRV